MLYTILTIVFALLCVPAWLYRGGSLLHGKIPGGPRIWRLSVTPLCVTAALGLMFCTGLTSGLYLLGTFALFTAASVWGWLDASDLGRDGDRSFVKELGLIYARFAMFLLPAIPAYFLSPFAMIPFIALAIFGPTAWMIENKIWFYKGKVPPIPFAETYTGAVIGLGVIATLLLI